MKNLNFKKILWELIKLGIGAITGYHIGTW